MNPNSWEGLLNGPIFNASEAFRTFADAASSFTDRAGYGYTTRPAPEPAPELVDVEMVIDGRRVKIPVGRVLLNQWRALIETRDAEQRWRDAQERIRASEERARRVRAAATSQPFTTTGDAITYLRAIAGTDTTDLKKLVRRAKRLTHPDLGGNPDDFRRVTDAENLLRGARRL